MHTDTILTITLPDGRTWDAPLHPEVVALLLAEADHLRIPPAGSSAGAPDAPAPSPAAIAAGELEGMLHRSLLVERSPTSSGIGRTSRT